MKPTLIQLRAAVSCLVLCFSLVGVQAQMRVGQPAGTPDPSAALEVSGGPYANGSPYRGIAPPKVALTQTTSATPVSSPVTGLLVYNTATTSDVTPGYYYWEGNQWMRFTTSAKAGSARVSAVNGQSIPAYLMSQVSGLTVTPDIIYIADPGQEGMFRYYGNSAATPVNGMVLNASGGQYKRIVTDGKITPQMFGAKGDGSTDDALALQAWYLTQGFQHFLPAGTYKCGAALVRENLGDVSIQGAGLGKSIINFYLDTDGLIFKNNTDAVLGAFTITNLEIRSTGPKSAGREALYVKSLQAQRPGPVIENVNISSTVVGQEWTTGLHLDDCGGTSAKGLEVKSSGLTKTTGILMTNSENKQSFEHNFLHIHIWNVKTGINLQSATTGSYGIEGVQFTDINIVGCVQGITGSTQISPFLGFKGVHINSQGGECLKLVNYQQVTFSECDFYCAKNGSIIPDRAVYIKNTRNCIGSIMVVLFDEIPNGVEFDGTGSGIDMNIYGDIYSDLSNVVKLNPTVSGGLFGVTRSLNGSVPGSGGKKIMDLFGGAREKMIIDAATSDPYLMANPALVYDPAVFKWKAIPRVQTTTLSTQFINASTANNTTVTVDPSVYNAFDIYNEANTVTISVDVNKYSEGQILYFKRYNNTSSGTITLQTSQSGSHLIQTPAGNFANSYNLPLSNRSMMWIWRGGHLELLSGFSGSYTDLTNQPTPYSLPAATPTTLGGVKLLSRQILTYAQPTNSDVTVDLSTSKHVAVINTGTGTVNLKLDYTTATTGDLIYIRHYDSMSTGPVTISTTTPNTNKVMDGAGAFLNVVPLPNSTNQRQMIFFYNGVHFEFMGY